jgi:hypothetical protein
LATHHIYREVKPDVFSNNRVSSLLDTFKPSAEVIAEYVIAIDGNVISKFKHILTPLTAQITNMTILMGSLPL